MAGINRYPLGNGEKHKVWIRFKRIDFTFDPEESKTTAQCGSEQPSVYLYMPGSIQFSDGISYGETELGTGGRLIEYAASRGALGSSRDLESTLGAAGDFLRSGTVEAFAQASNLLHGGDIQPTALAMVMSRFSALTNNGIGRGIRSNLRYTTNPHQRSMFERVNLRSFSFPFEFVPSNAEEARQAQEIINFFREIAYPQASGVTGSIQLDEEGAPGENRVQREMANINDLVYKFPSMVQVDIFYNLDGDTVSALRESRGDNSQSNLEELFDSTGNRFDDVVNSGMMRVGPRFQPCYITGFEQTLDPNNTMVYRPLDDRAVPASQTISVSLSEDRPLHQDSIKAGY